MCIRDRAKGLDAANAAIAGRISLGLFFAETNGNQNIGNARSNTYKGSFQTGPSEDRSGQMKWQAIRQSIMALDPKLFARDAAEEARAGTLDHRFNHWTAVRDGLMNAHAELFPRIPDIAKAVSYTHLDVYKRQSTSSSAATSVSILRSTLWARSRQLS